MSQSFNEMVNIFKGEKGFERLFSLFIKKYKSYGRVEKGISVMLTNPSHHEKSVLSGLIGKDYSNNKTIQLTAERIEKSLLKTKFCEGLETISFEEILTAYAGKPLISNRELEEKYLEERKLYFVNLNKRAASDMFVGFLEKVEQLKNNRFYQMHRQNKDLLDRVMSHLNKAFTLLPLKDYEYLPVFATKATGDPHAFDSDRTEGELFIYALRLLQPLDYDQGFRSLNAEKTTELLYDFKIMRDDVLNSVSVFNLLGKNKNGKDNLLLRGASLEKSLFPLPLREVVKLESVKTVSGTKRLFMIENSSVASHVVNELLEEEVDETVISGSGQFKVATLKLLDLFVEHGGVIYYSGDFDPEGLSMAVRLRKRFGDNLKFWVYDVNSYLNSLSDVQISINRLSQLSRIKETSLQPLIDEMNVTKRSGYQERLLNELVRDIKQYNLKGAI